MKTMHVFLGADMRMGHNGMHAFAKKEKVQIEDLAKGEAIVFINSKKDRMKSYAWNGVVSYVRSQDIKRPISLDVLDYLVQAFSEDGVMNYPKALKMQLEEKLSGKRLDPAHLSSKTAREILGK